MTSSTDWSESNQWDRNKLCFNKTVFWLGLSQKIDTPYQDDNDIETFITLSYWKLRTQRSLWCICEECPPSSYKSFTLWFDGRGFDRPLQIVNPILNRSQKEGNSSHKINQFWFKQHRFYISFLSFNINPFDLHLNKWRRWLKRISLLIWPRDAWWFRKMCIKAWIQGSEHCSAKGTNVSTKYWGWCFVRMEAIEIKRTELVDQLEKQNLVL